MPVSGHAGRDAQASRAPLLYLSRPIRALQYVAFTNTWGTPADQVPGMAAQASDPCRVAVARKGLRRPHNHRWVSGNGRSVLGQPVHEPVRALACGPSVMLVAMKLSVECPA